MPASAYAWASKGRFSGRILVSRTQQGHKKKNSFNPWAETIENLLESVSARLSVLVAVFDGNL